MAAALSAALALAALFAMAAASPHKLELKISPTKAGIKKGSSINITCKSKPNEALVGCEFKIRRYAQLHATGKDRSDDGPVLNFAQNESSKVTVLGFGKPQGLKLYNAQYHGGGLSNGECGIELSSVANGRYLVGCRARANNGGWAEKYMPLFVKDVKTNFKSEKAENETVKFVTLAESYNVDFKVNGDKSVQSCNFYLPDSSNETVSAGISSPSIGNIELINSDKMCGMKIVKATDASNGPTWVEAPLRDGREWYFMTIIIITKAPTENSIALDVDNGKTGFAAGEMLSAACSVAASRPAARVTVSLGNETLAAVQEPAWTWPWEEAAVSQAFRKRLELSDDGKLLDCIVRHEALLQEIVKSYVVRVTEKPVSVKLIAIPVALSACVLAAIAAVCYAIVKGTCCFKQTGLVARETAAVQVPKVKKPPAKLPVEGKRRADTPDREPETPSTEQRDSGLKVVYAQLAEFQPSASNANNVDSQRRRQEPDTAYAELNFR